MAKIIGDASYASWFWGQHIATEAIVTICSPVRLVLLRLDKPTF
jgi:hypothetical protein